MKYLILLFGFVAQIAYTGEDYKSSLLKWIRNDTEFSQKDEIANIIKLSGMIPESSNLTIIRLLLTKSKYRKEHFISGSEEYAKLAEIKLKETTKPTNSKEIVSYYLVLSQTYELRDLNDKAAAILEEFLQNYYPEILKSKRESIDSTANIAMQKLGALYITLAESTNDVETMKDYYSRAAGILIRTAGKDAFPKDNALRLLACKQAITLLGYKLNLPQAIEKQLPKEGNYLLHRLFNQKKFKTVLKLLQKAECTKDNLDMQLTAAANAGKNDFAINTAKQLIARYPEDSLTLILQAATVFENRNMPESTFELYKLYLNVAPQSNLTFKVRRKYADYCLQNKRYHDALPMYLKLGENTSLESETKSDIFTKTGFCLFNNKKHADAIGFFEKAETSATNEKTKNELKQYAIHSALQETEKQKKGSNLYKQYATYALKNAGMLIQKKLDNEFKRDILLMALVAAEKTGELYECYKYLGMLEKIKHKDETHKISSQLLLQAINSKDCSLAFSITKFQIDHHHSDSLKQAVTTLAFLTQNKSDKFALTLIKKLEKQKLNDVYLNNLCISLESIASHSPDIAYKQLFELLSPRLSKLSGSPLVNKFRFLTAKSAQQIGKSKIAYDLYTNLITQHEKYEHIEVMLNHAQLANEIGDTDIAIKDYTELLLINKNPLICAHVCYCLANIYMVKKDYAKAAATSSFCIPMIDKYKLNEDIKGCLELACKAYTHLSKNEELQPLIKLYIKNYPDSDQSKKFRKYLK